MDVIQKRNVHLFVLNGLCKSMNTIKYWVTWKPGLRKWKEIDIKHIVALEITEHENYND